MVGILSDVGKVRKLNEDCVGFYEGNDFKVYVIADGMGGHNAGEVASKIAVDTTISYMKSIKISDNMQDDLIKAINIANEKIFKLSKSREDLSGMGTTITACLVKDDHMITGNVGDSGCYIIKKDGISKITKDHSLVQQLIDEGSITEEEAAVHPNKNIITRALGTNASVEVDTFNVNLKDVDRVLICTDGLSNEVSVNEMYEIIMKNSNNKDACKQLIDLSKLRGGRDNISVIVFEGECKYDRNNSGK
ncbi:Stp1/IreP family PP2C-type Ser/Thr phosphatase [Clostridium tyrobutyricum]|jgi:protein phosphatase|uniref:protein-serine/threonine phosphatase n=2 Tax=Clostridium tyrobutyricum TaxID=1519 RepID=W6N1J4_CLOTY|nr:Stp1/IreP family PP2C-type Ser/Thr phosphatase [Clostridium tyrobutyricum]AND85093.1 protein phosphatase PrpC-like protein [Clostridium tyrobutyricum]ANP69651.1 protein phosphatase [Clostridium tyrobutyricum]MBV4414921.1 Stp1/IreP family PP2C-type Ser/Thr phosphatase [Clostridium tyrobutyricum]MBV4420781.1 Stp1/IreP family PP2C-type Ser/Thr phosphatase [Clostridium tyrobutyricum]MBV4423891.1 Stp1/IreP family PP2C-type Ser/Thr phosphatase [Clostridium tyrobutyricum]